MNPMSQASIITIDILPEKQQITSDSGEILSEILERAGLKLWYPCGRAGSCGKCRVIFHQGAPVPCDEEMSYFSSEELEAGNRLACRCSPTMDCLIEIPHESLVHDMHVLTDSLRTEFELNPIVSCISVDVMPPAMDNLKSDDQLVKEALDKINPLNNYSGSLYYLRKLPPALRANNFKISIIHDHNTMLDIGKADGNDGIYGAAVDIGTTTVAASLIDLSSGQTLDVESMLNPQSKFGDDLISRVSAISSDRDVLSEQSRLIIAGINKMMDKLSQRNAVPQERIYAMVCAGNTVMQQIFLNVDPGYVAESPFTATFCQAQNYKAEELGISIFPEGRVLTMPNIGGFVGGDIAADLIAAGFGDSNNKTRLLLDIGTNCELVLEYGHRKYATSSPAGPALEGARISCGLRAEAGAIADVKRNSHGYNFHTIGGQAVRGICGSGLFHVIDIFRQDGLIGNDGTIMTPGSLKGESYNHQLRNDANGMLEIVLATIADGANREVFLSQKDIREFQLARAAIITAWKMLCRFAGCKPEDIDEVYVAGAFGNFIRPDTLINLGLIPATRKHAIHFIGNGALQGARLTLLDRSNLALVGKIVTDTRFIELGGDPEFQDIFVDHLYF